MTLDELVASLPNGLHDAELGAVMLDFTRREARLELDIWIGDDRDREVYRRAEVTLSGVLFWVSEPPDFRYPYASRGPVKIDVGALTDKRPERQPALPPIPQGANANWVFVNDWNAFIFVASERANLKWLGDPVNREG